MFDITAATFVATTPGPSLALKSPGLSQKRWGLSCVLGAGSQIPSRVQGKTCSGFTVIGPGLPVALG